MVRIPVSPDNRLRRSPSSMRRWRSQGGEDVRAVLLSGPLLEFDEPAPMPIVGGADYRLDRLS